MQHRCCNTSNEHGWGRFDDDRSIAQAQRRPHRRICLGPSRILATATICSFVESTERDHISIELKPNQQAMTALLSINHLAWLSSNDEDSATSRQHAVEIDHRGSTLYAGEARRSSSLWPCSNGSFAVCEDALRLSLGMQPFRWTVQSRNRTCFAVVHAALALTIAPIVPSISNEPQIGRATSPNASHSEGSTRRSSPECPRQR